MPQSSRYLTILVISFISLFEIIKAVILEPKVLGSWDLEPNIQKSWVPETWVFLWICLPADADAFKPIVISTALASAPDTFLAAGKSIFDNGSRGLRRDLPDWIISDICISDNFILVDKWFEKYIQRF